MKIAIYNRGIPFAGTTPFSQPLGGSETSIVHMARELSRCGHDVTVYCCLPAEAKASETDTKPEYKSYVDFFNDCVFTPWDVLVSFRCFDPFLLGRIAPRMIFWTGDASNQPALKNFAHESLQENIDAIFCVSQWQKNSFIQAFDLPAEKV